MSQQETHSKKTRILIAGGYGEIGRHIAQHIRNEYPGIELILTGRTPEKGQALAAELGNTEVRALDLDKPFDLSSFGEIDLIIASLIDPANVLVQAATELGINYISMTRLVNELTPLLLATLHKDSDSVIVLADHWQAGILTLIAKDAASAFSQIDTIQTAALFDEADPIGPMVAEQMDSFSGPALLRKNSKWEWLSSPENSRELTLQNGDQITAYPVAALDVNSLAAITGAPNIRFDLAIGQSIGTHKGQIASHDMYIDIEGTLKSGVHAKIRTLISGTRGQSSMTALGVLLSVEGVLSLNTQAKPQKGKIYLPETLLNNNIDKERLKGFGIYITSETL